MQNRLTHSPDEVIDPEWYIDWDESTLWLFGVTTFADFAVFRAELKEGEGWRELLTLVPRATFHREGDGTTRYVDFEQNSPSEYLKPYGVGSIFASQDWYDSSEWHDNLGWEIGWIDSTHPYMPDESWDSMSEFKNVQK